MGNPSAAGGVPPNPSPAERIRPEWLFIDGSSLIFRAFYGVPSSVRGPDGRPINAIRGFLETLARLVVLRQPRRWAIGSDADWRPQHRVDLIPSYKTHRVAEPVPPALEPQFETIHALLDAIGVDFIGAPNLEAEDVIASWVTQITGRIEVVSGDRDLFALVRDPDVAVLYPEKGGWLEVDEAEITRRYGVPGRLYADFAMLRGDPSDGLPGLPGVGAKTAATLVARYGGVDGLLASGTLSDRDADYLRRAQQVVLPGSATPIPLPQGRRDQWPMDSERLDGLCVEYGVRSSVDRLLSACATLNDQADETAAPPAT